MGEYAAYKGDQIKIGTCESMYYLRFDQREKVQALSGNVDPNGADAYSIRFRFPFPDEDSIEPGDFEAYGRSIPVHGLKAPTEVDHYSIQFQAVGRGLLTSLPCPNGKGPHPVDIGRNGYAGDVRIVQQRLMPDGALWTVCECGACGSLWRLPLEEAEELAVALRAEADRQKEAPTGFYHTIADRVLAGYARAGALTT